MNSYAQAGQDVFVYELLEHKTDGWYVDLGCSDATKHSNSYFLERLGWRGILVDIVDGCELRAGTFIKSDAANPNARLKLHYKTLPAVVDYLSADCDDSTLGALNALPWNKVTFRCMTIEHDVYRIGPTVRDAIRDVLFKRGYTLVCADVVVEWPEGTFVPYEDWWCYAPLVPPEMMNRFKSEDKYWRDILGL